MRRNFHQIAYEALAVCNALEPEALAACVGRTGLGPGARALEIGAGNGTVGIVLARDFGMTVEAVELDWGMAAMAQARIAGAGVADRVTLHRLRSEVVLEDLSDLDLITAIGVTDPVGEGVREPRAMLEGLRPHLRDGGFLIWGDLFWKAEPPAPLRQLTEMTNLHETHDGWQAAALAAGYEVVSADVSSEETWDRYLATMDGAARAWLDANPEAPEHKIVQASADRVRAMFEFGRPYMGFGLYLFRKVT
ncbi:MAG: class I SAM-dependent methyltransferase [Caulobacteraceae bacterium]|nr:class I SAM-dependent methyltransferase [Caulobacteraceae bacterium]